MRIVVAGGTGLVGRHLVSALTGQHEVVILSRSKGVDLTTGRGLPGALSGEDAAVGGPQCPPRGRPAPPGAPSGAHALLHPPNTPTQRRRASVDFFTTSSRQLVDAGRREG